MEWKDRKKQGNRTEDYFKNTSKEKNAVCIPIITDDDFEYAKKYDILHNTKLYQIYIEIDEKYGDFYVRNKFVDIKSNYISKKSLLNFIGYYILYRNSNFEECRVIHVNDTKKLNLDNCISLPSNDSNISIPSFDKIGFSFEQLKIIPFITLDNFYNE
jgi:hypothetical protein